MPKASKTSERAHEVVIEFKRRDRQKQSSYTKKA
jgi:hypothetical protein